MTHPIKDLSTHERSKGFTILEIMIVVVVISVLVSLALPKFYGMVERTRAIEAITVLQEMRMAMERCYISRMTYTGCTVTTANELTTLMTGVNHHFTLSGSSAGPGTWAIQLERNTYEIGTTDPGGSLNCSPYFGNSGHSQIVGCLNASGFAIVGSGYYEGIDTTPN